MESLDVMRYKTPKVTVVITLSNQSLYILLRQRVSFSIEIAAKRPQFPFPLALVHNWNAISVEKRGSVNNSIKYFVYT